MMPIVDDDGKITGLISEADVDTRLHEPETTAEAVDEMSRKSISARAVDLNTELLCRTARVMGLVPCNGQSRKPLSSFTC